MNKSVVIIVVLVLLSGGALYVIKQNQEATMSEMIQEARIKATKRIEDEKAKQKALAEKVKRVAAEKAAQEAQRLKAEALKAKQMAEESARQKAAELQGKISGLINQAKTLLDSGKFQEAINVAKNVLNLDANNIEAKSILEMATTKLKEFAQEKAASLTKDAKGTLNTLTPNPSTP